MMLIACPHCGPRAHVEFDYGRSLDAVLPLNATSEEAAPILYQRANPKGPSAELWRHGRGCRAWLLISRDTLTHQIQEVVAWPPRAEDAP